METGCGPACLGQLPLLCLGALGAFGIFLCFLSTSHHYHLNGTFSTIVKLGSARAASLCAGGALGC